MQATLKSKLTEDICLQLTVENHPFCYLCDCGMASELTVKDCRDTAAIFVSHTHIDHFINFDGIMRHQLAIGRRVIVCGPVGLARNVQAKMLAFNWNLLKYDDMAVSYEVRELHPDGRISRYHLVTPEWQLTPLPDMHGPMVYENEVFTVHAVLLDHGVDVVAYLFVEHPKVRLMPERSSFNPGKWVKEAKEALLQGDSQRQISLDGEQQIAAGELFSMFEVEQGFRLAYVMDHAATEENAAKIRALCHQADEVYVEAYYMLEDHELAERNKHSMAGFTARVLREAGVKRAIPIHFSRRYQDEEGQRLILQEFHANFAPEG